jgi:hypothetical protein
LIIFAERMPMPAMPRFAIGRARGRIAALALAALFALPPAAACAGSVARAGSPARLSVAVPPATEGAGVVMLEIGIAAGRNTAVDRLGAAVRLRGPGGAVELGRISIVAAGARERRSYQFNIAPALRRLGATGGAIEVEVEPIDRGGAAIAKGAALDVGPARIVSR